MLKYRSCFNRLLKFSGSSRVSLKHVGRQYQYLQNNKLESRLVTRNQSFVKLNQNISVRSFKTSCTNHAIPPPIILLLGKVSKIGAAALGRSFRWWWHRLPPEEKSEHLTKLKSKWRYFLAFSGLIGLSGFAYYETHIEEAPITKRKRFVVFSNEQFDEISKDILYSLLAESESHIISPKSNNLLYALISDVAERLLNANNDIDGIHDKFWTITVVDDESERNAFVLPCGSIFVYTGMLKFIENEDQLGIILGHEMAHAILGHGKESHSFAHLVDLLMILPFAILWVLIPSDITAAALHWITHKFTEDLLDLPYSRFREAEADAVGLQLAAKACFDIREAPMIWAKAKAARDEEDPIWEKWLSTHPTHEDRVMELSNLIPDAIKIRDCASCPRLPPKDPREREIENVSSESKDLDELLVVLNIK